VEYALFREIEGTPLPSRAWTELRICHHPQKRTSLSTVVMSVLCQKRTFCTAGKNFVIRPRRGAIRTFVRLGCELPKNP